MVSEKHMQRAKRKRQQTRVVGNTSSGIRAHDQSCFYLSRLWLLHQRLSLDHVIDWDWRVCVYDRRHVGYTLPSGASPCQFNYLPANCGGLWLDPTISGSLSSS